MDVAELVEKYREYVRGLRRHFHQYPELSYEEQETTKFIAGELEKMGIPYEINPEKNTGIIAVIQGAHEGKCVGLRADMDALPVQEINTFDFKSKVDGRMHACGHDGHMAVLLGAARMLVQMKEELYGSVYLIFQPAEENGTGAPYMMRFGDWFERVDSIFGGHIWLDLPAGKVSIEEGERMAAADEFYVTIHGRPGHGSQPHQTVDAVVVASAMVMNLQTVVSRSLNPIDSAAITIGGIKSDTYRFNIIAGEASMAGTTRYFNRHILPDMRERMKQVIENTAKAYGATAELDYREMVPPVVNDPECSRIAAAAVAKVMGAEAVSPMRKVTGGEDFGFYMQHKPCCFAFFGLYNEEIGACHSHHSNNFNLDDSVLSAASGVYAQYAIDWLLEHR
jgi:amidohydrolase